MGTETRQEESLPAGSAGHESLSLPAETHSPVLQKTLDDLRLAVVKRSLARRGLYLKPKEEQHIAGRSYEQYSFRKVPVKWLDLRRSWRGLLRRWLRRKTT